MWRTISMKRIFLFITICALAVSLLPLASGSPKDAWYGLHSKNFYLIGNASEKNIREVATRLEQFREAFTKVFPGTKAAAAQPITVIVFKNHASFVPFMPVHNGKTLDVAGYFQASDEGRFILLSSQMTGDYPYSTIFHEYVHSLTEDSSRPLPTWLSEGMAEVYSTFQITGDRNVNLGLPIAGHIYALRQSRFLTIPELFAVNTNSGEYNEGSKRSVFYAESWALLHYLMLGNGAKRRPQLQKFIQSINSGLSSEESFRASFDVDYQTLQKELQDYVQQSAYHYATYQLDEKLDFDKNALAATISEAEAEYRLGTVLYLQTRPDGETHLRNAATLDPNLAEAQALLGRILMTQGKVTEAKEHLERAVTANSKSYLAHYDYARALSKETAGRKLSDDNFPTENIPQIRSELKKAIELNPDFIESYPMLGFVNLVDNKEIDESIQFLNRALGISPGHENVNFILGQLYLRKKDIETARKFLEPLTQTAKMPEMRDGAAEILKQAGMSADSLALYQNFLRKQKASADPGPSGAVVSTNSGNSADANKPKASTDQPLAAPKLCATFPGEEKRGLLTKIECSGTAVVLVVESEGKTIRFDVVDPNKLEIITCGSAGGKGIKCGALKKPESVAVFYQKPNKPSKSIEGLATAVVFVQPQ